MDNRNGVIRVGRKGMKKFAFGEDGEPFNVDVVVAFQEWVGIDTIFRDRSEDQSILIEDMPQYHAKAVEFVVKLSGNTIEITTAEALDLSLGFVSNMTRWRFFFDPNCEMSKTFQILRGRSCASQRRANPVRRRCT